MAAGDATVPLRETLKEVALQRFELQVEEGPDEGRVQRFDPSEFSTGEFSIGTAQGNQLVLTDTTVSRHHCAISATRNGFMIRDLGSMNGTKLGGFRVEVGYVKDKASLRLGRTKLRFRRLAEEVRQPLSEGETFGAVLGRSPAMRRIFALLPRIAQSETSILLEGETGTGKGLLAEAIHDASARAKGPFVVLDCAAIPRTLVESELFGHIKGAFTGAHADRAGAFEAANGGTIFLDEIGELPLDMQPKLLRALEERTIKPVGGTAPVKLNVRVVAATNRDLREEVNTGNFRADLYYRLNVVRLCIPPLRDRQDDVRLLVSHFYEQFCPDEPKPPATLVEALMRQSWPGNVRELRSAVERSVLLGDPNLGAGKIETIEVATPSVEPAFDPSLSFRAAKEAIVANWERAYLTELVKSTGGNLSKAARTARMDRNHLRELLKRHDVMVKP